MKRDLLIRMTNVLKKEKWAKPIVNVSGILQRENESLRNVQCLNQNFFETWAVIALF